MIVRGGGPPGGRKEGGEMIDPYHNPEEPLPRAENAWRYKCVRTAALAMAMMVMGLETCLLGPTVLDLRERLGLTMEEFSRTYVCRNVGAILGSILGGAGSDKFNKHMSLVMAAALGVTGVCTIHRPWADGLLSFSINSFICGIAHSAINPTANALLFSLWGQEVTTPMFIMHTGFALGCPLAPLLAKNYLSQDSSHSLSDPIPSPPLKQSHISAAVRTETSSWWLYGDRSQVEVPLTAVGLIFILLSSLFWMLDREKLPKGATTSQAHGNSADGGGGPVAPYWKIVPMVAIFYMTLVAMETPLFSFLFPFMVESTLGFTKQEAVYLDFVGKIAVLISRVVSIAASRFLSIHAVLSISMLGCACSIFGLDLFGKYSVPHLWLFACSNSFFMSSLWPAGYSWAKQYVHLTGTMLGSWDVCSALTRIVVTWYSGYLYQFSSPYAIFSLASYSGVLALLSYLSLHVMQVRFMWRKPHQTHAL